MQKSMQIARSYAIAVFKFSTKNKYSLLVWKNFLIKLNKITKLKILKYFSYNVYPKKTLVKVLLILLNQKINQYCKNFIKLIIHYNKLHLTKYILVFFIELYDEYNKTLQIQLITSKQISKIQKNKICSILKNKFLKNIKLSHTIDPSIIQGFILYYKNTIINHCISHYLRELSHFLLL